jgi:hypothetical protein
MRALRTFFGVVLLLAGVPMVLLAAAGWSVLRNGPEAEGFAPTHAYVRTAGRAVVVGDVAGLAERTRVPVLPGSDRVRVTVRSTSGPLFVAVAPVSEVDRYLDGVARTEFSGVSGPLDVDGRVAGPVAAGQAFWDVTAERRGGVETLEWTPRPDRSLVIMRADGEPAIDATVAIGSYPAWLDTGTWWLLTGGLAAVMVGVGLLFWPQRRREVVLVVEAHRMVDFADRIADRLGGGRSDPIYSGRHHDVTGELVMFDRDGFDRDGESPYVSTAT